MAAQTATNRIGKSLIGRLNALQLELAGSTPTDIESHTTVTLTLVYTAATDAITLDRAVT